MQGNKFQIPQLINLLRLGGLWMNFNGYKLERLQIFANHCRLFGIIFIWFLQALLIYRDGLTFLLSESAVFMPIGVNLVVIGTVTILKFPTIERTIKYTVHLLELHKEQWEIDLINVEVKVATKLVNIFKTFLNLFAVFYVILPLVIDLIRAYFDYDKPYKVPLPLDGYLDRVLTRNTTFYLTTFLSYFWFLLTVTNYIAFQSFVFYMVSFANAEMEIIKTKLKLLSDDGRFLANNSGAVSGWDLKDIVIWHQRLLVLVKLQKQSVGMQLSFQNSISSGTLCLVMYLLNKSYSADKILFGFCMIFLIFAIVLFIVICNQGQSIQSTSEEMFATMCDAPWFVQNCKIRRDYNLILMQAKRVLVYDYRGTSPINRAAFMLMLNRAYSYFMLIKSLE